MNNKEAKARMKEMLTFLPNLLGLCGRLMADARVAKTEKTLVASAIVYALAPLDFLPDLLPFIGQVDDAYLVSLTLLRLINRTDEKIVREHWRGETDVVLLANSLAGVAPLVLPKRISRIVSAKIDFAPLFKQIRRNEKPKLIGDTSDDETKSVVRVV